MREVERQTGKRDKEREICLRGEKKVNKKGGKKKGISAYALPIIELYCSKYLFFSFFFWYLEHMMLVGFKSLVRQMSTFSTPNVNAQAMPNSESILNIYIHTHTLICKIVLIREFTIAKFHKTNPLLFKILQVL